MTEVTPEMELVKIDGADHMSAMRQPEYIEALQQFLISHSASSTHEGSHSKATADTVD